VQDLVGVGQRLSSAVPITQPELIKGRSCQLRAGWQESSIGTVQRKSDCSGSAPVLPCVRRYTDPVQHLSDWHDFVALDRTTYPTVDGPVQVRYSTGTVRSGFREDFFPRRRLLTEQFCNVFTRAVATGRHVQSWCAVLTQPQQLDCLYEPGPVQ
jgi:hypothetical protein